MVLGLWVLAGCAVEGLYRLNSISKYRHRGLTGLLVRVLLWPVTIYVVARLRNA